jgi:hypothetical protein
VIGRDDVGAGIDHDTVSLSPSTARTSPGLGAGEADHHLDRKITDDGRR